MAPLTEEERAFAVSHHYLIREYLRMRRLPYDDWYDVVVFRYLWAVQQWHRRLELHYYSFRTIAYQNMRSAVGNEYLKQGRRIQAVSLDAEIPGTDGLTYGETITYDNLRRAVL